jgi:tetratricopeptide (TPR) repeat protein
MASTSRNKVSIEQGTATNTSSQHYEAKKQQNLKKILIVIGAIIAIIAGYFGYKELIQKPNGEKASVALFRAERWFEIDSFNLVINGDGQNEGALAVAQKYGSTAAGNSAYYLLGMSYLKTGDFENAVTYLSKFKGAGTPFEFLAYGNLGDAYMELGQTDKGIEAYKKAANQKGENLITPLYLYRAGLASKIAGNNEEAIKCFKRIKEEFPTSLQAREIEKSLASLGVIN